MYLIYGIQKSGLSIVNYFENKKIKFKMWDDNPIVRTVSYTHLRAHET